MAALLSRRAFAVASLFTRKSRISSPISAGDVYSVSRPIIQRINIPSCVAPTRLYSTPAQIAEDGEDDVLYKKLFIEVKGHDPTVLNSYQKFVSMAARELDVNITDIQTPPRKIERYTLLKSVHIYSKHRVQYETRTHFRSFDIKHITGSTADTFLEYIQRNLPEGIAMKVTKHRIEVLPAHLQPPPDQSSTTEMGAV